MPAAWSGAPGFKFRLVDGLFGDLACFISNSLQANPGIIPVSHNHPFQFISCTVILLLAGSNFKLRNLENRRNCVVYFWFPVGRSRDSHCQVATILSNSSVVLLLLAGIVFKWRTLQKDRRNRDVHADQETEVEMDRTFTEERKWSHRKREALDWNLQGKRRRGRPRHAWRRTVHNEAVAKGKNWNEVKRMAGNRTR